MNVGGINDPLKPQSAASPVDQIGKSFSDMLASLTQSENQSDNVVAQLSSGGNVDIHDLMISMQETDVQFRVAMGIRDQLVNAYREAMRMQV